jgi:peptide/nickel transport system substrate-binding protein
MDEGISEVERLWMTRRGLLRAGGAAALAAAAAPVIAACGSDAGSGGTDQVRWLVPEAIDRLDVGYAVGTVGGTVLLGLEPLILLDTDGKLGPNLAKSFTQPDPLTFVYTLREGVKFWDGKPLTADDVVYSLNLHAKKGSESKLARVYSNVASIEATGPNEATMRMKAGDPQVQYGVAISGIVERAFHEGKGKRIGTPAVLNMGTGPFKFDSFSVERTVLTRNDDYWGEKPKISRLELRTLPEESARLLAVRSGDVDGSFAVPNSQYDQYKRIRGVTLKTAPDPAVIFFALNQKKAPWNDLQVRRALAYAIDREGIIKAVLSGRGRRAVTLTTPESLQTLLPKARVEELTHNLDRYTFDLDRAREELSKSSVPNGFSDRIIFDDAEPDLGRVAEIVSQSLAKIGIRLDVRETDENNYSVRVWRTHKEGISIVNFGPDGPEPSNIPLFTLHSRNRLPASYTNIAEYSNKEIDRLFEEEEGMKANDPRRGERLARALEIAAQDLPYIPIYFAESVMAHRESVGYGDYDALWFLERWTNQLAVD